MICTIVPCPAEGQSYSSNCRQIGATCSNPSIPAICDVPACACPLGQVVDEETNKCINISECSKFTFIHYTNLSCNKTFKGEVLWLCSKLNM